MRTWIDGTLLLLTAVLCISWVPIQVIMQQGNISGLGAPPPDYYVTQAGTDTSGGVDPNGTTAANPYSAAEFNAGSFSPGDVIDFSGTITSQIIVPSSGSSGSMITLDVADATFTGDHAGQIYIETKDYITITGAGEFSGAGHDGVEAIKIVNGSTHITIEDVYIHDISESTGAKCAGIYVTKTSGSARSSYITIDGVEIADVTGDTGDGDIILAHADHVVVRNSKLHGSTGEGIDGIVALLVDNFLIEKNSIYDHTHATLGEDGIDLKGCSDVVIRWNYINNHRANGINVNKEDSSGTDCENIVIYGNWIQDCRANILVNDMTASGGLYAWANVLYGDTERGITMNDGSIPATHFNNNTVVNCGNTDYSITHVGASNSVYQNNLIYVTAKAQVARIYAGSPTFVDGHYYYASGTAVFYSAQSLTSVDAAATTGDPLFVNHASGDLSLQSGSPCRASGTAISTTVPTISVQGVNISPSMGDLLDPDSVFTSEPPDVTMLSTTATPDKGAYAYAP